MPELEIAAKILGSIIALVTVLNYVKKLLIWWKPGTIEISSTIVLDGSRSDSITVHITNRSGTAIYVRSCEVRSTHSIIAIIWLHLKHPLLHPRLYPNLRYNGALCFEFISGEAVKIEPAQLKDLSIDIDEHPLNAVYGPMLLAKAVLTSGQVIRSKRIESPPVWKLIGYRGR
jgi:hypothetical protein